MFLIGFGENIGSGFPLILYAWKIKDWDEPIIKDFPDLEETKLILKTNIILSSQGENNSIINGSTELGEGTKGVTKEPDDGTKDGTKESDGGTKGGTKEPDDDTKGKIGHTINLTERQRNLWTSIKENPSVQSTALAKMLNISIRTLRREIAILQKKGYILRQGGRKDGFWKVII